MSDQNTPPTGFVLRNTTYNRLKWAVMIVLPAVAALYITLSGFWGLPKVEEVAGTITALAAFLGVLLGISTKNYPGETVNTVGELLVMGEVNGEEQVQVSFDEDPHLLIQDTDVLPLRVVRE